MIKKTDGGDKIIDDLLVRPTAFYEKNNIQFRQGRVISIDRKQQILMLARAQLCRILLLKR